MNIPYATICRLLDYTVLIKADDGMYTLWKCYRMAGQHQDTDVTVNGIKIKLIHKLGSKMSPNLITV